MNASLSWRPIVRTLALLALIALLISLDTTPRALATPLASDPNTLYMTFYEPDQSTDPAIAYDGAGPTIFWGAYDSLVQMKGSSPTQVEGVLATSWSANPGSTVWTFHLRKGVLFHDGTPFNADAVKFSIQRLLAINSAPAFILGQFMTSKGITVIDPYTVQFHLTGPAPRLLYAMASQWANWIVSPTAIKKHTVKNDWGQAWMSSHDAGSGPYMITQVVPNTTIIMDQFPQYWRGWAGHHVKRVILSFISQDSTRRSLIEKGGADIAQAFTPQDLTAMSSNPALKLDTSTSLQNLVLIPTVGGPFTSVAARQALAYAFDYDAVNKGLLKGYAIQAQGPLARGTYSHDDSLPMYHTDMAKAKTLFAQAGVKTGTRVTLWYDTADPREQDVALVTQGQLAQVGISVDIVGKDNATYFNMLAGTEPLSQRPNLWAGVWYPDYNDPIDWLSPLYETQSGGNGAANAGLYHDAQVDKLLGEAAVATDNATRLSLDHQIQNILTWTDPGAVFVSDLTNSTVYRAGLHGYSSNPVYTNGYNYYNLWK